MKNVSGRKLIGLRYWNRTTESGDNEWQFECRDADGMAALVPEEKHLFWLTVYLTPVLWVLFAIFSLLKFSLGYLMLCTLGATLGAANVVGFTKSSSEARAELSSRGAGLLSYAASQLWGRGGSSAAAART